MTINHPIDLDPDELGTLTCIEYSVYRDRIKLQCLADRYREKPDTDISPLADLAVTQIDLAWRTLTKITRIIEGRRAAN